MTTKNFAELDSNNTVLRILSINESDAPTEDAGIFFLQNMFGGVWIETFVDGSLRKRLASIGGQYNVEHNVFVDQSPYSNWILNSDFDWIPPVHYPTDGKIYKWDVDSVSWIEHDYCCENCEEEAQETPAISVTTPWKY
jgi:hypothetical protein